MERSLFTELVKLPSLWILTSLFFGSASLEAFYLVTEAPSIEDRLGRKKLSEAIEKSTLKALLDCEQILIAADRSKESFKMDLILKKDVRFPDKETLRCTLDSNKMTSKTLSINFRPELIERYGPTWLAERLAKQLIEKLLQYAANTKDHGLSSDLSKNISDLGTPTSQPRPALDIDVLSNRTQMDKELSLQKIGLMRNKKLPVAQRRQQKAPTILYSFGQTPRAKVTAFKRIAKEDIPYQRLPLNPYHREKSSTLKNTPTNHYPSFQTGGPLATFLTPSLQLPEVPRESDVQVSTSTTISYYHFHDQAGHFSDLRWEGYTTKQTITVASRFWDKLHLSLLAGYGGHSGDFNFESDLDSAKGGSTFLRNGQTGSGLLDTQLNMHTIIESGKFLIRPHLSIKSPTADEKHALGNGGVDTGFGISFETLKKAWSLKSQITYTQPADLDIFEAGQKPLPAKNYVYLGIGAARKLWSEDVHLAFAVNWMSNPLSGSTELKPLQQALSSVAVQIGQNLRHGHLSIEASRGITLSSISNSYGLNFNVSF
jgi:hypothetical protein